MKKCPKCGVEQKDTVKFCSECGAGFPEPKVLKDMFCEKCKIKKRVEEGSVCDTCGSKLVPYDPNIKAEEGTIFNKEDFDNTLYYASEDTYINKLVSEEMSKSGNAFSRTLPSIEIRKSIMTLIYGIVFILFMTLYAFYHVFLLGFFFLFIVLTIIYIIQLFKYNIKSYILKDIKARPDEKISNIVASTLSGASNNRVIFMVFRLIFLVVCFMLPIFMFREAHMIYERQDEDYVIRYYTLSVFDQEDKIVIPSTYKGRKVVGIRGDVFKNIYGLYEVELPETLEEIRGGAFKNCYNLEVINIPKSVKRIGGEAFYNCYSLKKIELPEGLDEIHGSTFEECSSLESVNIPDSVTRIGGHAFRSCRSLKEVKLTEKSQLREIGSSAFRECYELDEITLPLGVICNERAFKDSPTIINYFPGDTSWLTEKYANSVKQEFNENDDIDVDLGGKKYNVIYFGDLPSMYQFKIFDESNNSKYLTISKSKGYVEEDDLLIIVSGYDFELERIEVTFYYN